MTADSSRPVLLVRHWRLTPTVAGSISRNIDRNFIFLHQFRQITQK